MNKNQLNSLQEGDLVIVPQETEPQKGSVSVGDYVIMQDNDFMCAAGEIGRVSNVRQSSERSQVLCVEFSYGSDRRTSFINSHQIAKIADPEDAYRTLEHMLADKVLQKKSILGDVDAGDVKQEDVLFSYDRYRSQIREHHIQSVNLHGWNAIVVIYDLVEDVDKGGELTLKFVSSTLRTELKSSHTSGLFSTISKALYSLEEELYQEAIPFLKKRMSLYRSRWNLVGAYNSHYANRSYIPVDPVTGKMAEFSMKRLLLFQCPFCGGYADYVVREAVASMPAYPDSEDGYTYIHETTVHTELDDCAIEFDRCPHCLETLEDDRKQVNFTYVDVDQLPENTIIKLKSPVYDSCKE